MLSDAFGGSDSEAKLLHLQDGATPSRVLWVLDMS